MIRVQKFNIHIANGYKKLVRAFKREAVQFLVAKSLTSVSSRPWSRDILRFAVFYGNPLGMKNMPDTFSIDFACLQTHLF